MLIPIALGLAWPDRVPDAAAAVDWTQPRRRGSSSRSTTRPSPRSPWPGPPGRRGGTAPAVYNAANEVCVEAFRDGRLRFTDIVPTVASVLDAPRRTLEGAPDRRRRPRRRRLGARAASPPHHRPKDLR